MQLNHFSDYALRVLMYVARNASGTVTIAEIAHVHGISENHLMKVVNRLATLKYLTTVRGRGGGIKLGRAAEDISIGSVVRELEPLAIVECMSIEGGDCRLAPSCALSAVLDSALHAFLKTLDQYSLADISKSRRVSRREQRPKSLVT